MPDSTELWLPVEGFVGLYEVSNHGRIRSLDRRGKDGRRLSGATMCGSIQQGYVRTRLSGSGRTPRFFLHRLVAQAFLGPCPEGEQVNHKDGNKLNNAATNLEYVTPAGNTTHAIEAGLRNLVGERNHATPLTASVVREIRERFDSGETQTTIAKDVGISQAAISKIVLRHTWKHVH